MTLDSISKNVIEKLKVMPHEVLKGQLCDYKSFWDKYKEQLQFQVDPSYDMYEEEVKDLASDILIGMGDDDILNIFNTIKDSYNALRFVPSWEINTDTYRPPASFKGKKNHIIETVLLHVQAQASSEEVEYREPHIRYIKYVEQDLTVIAEIIKRLNPWDYTVLTISRNLPIKVETINIPDLRSYNKLSEITQEEFIELKDSFHTGQRNSEKANFKKSLMELVKIKARAEKKRPLEVIREMQYELEQRKSKTSKNDSSPAGTDQSTS